VVNQSSGIFAYRTVAATVTAWNIWKIVKSTVSKASLTNCAWLPPRHERPQRASRSVAHLASAVRFHHWSLSARPADTSYLLVSALCYQSARSAVLDARAETYRKRVLAALPILLCGPHMQMRVVEHCLCRDFPGDAARASVRRWGQPRRLLG